MKRSALNSAYHAAAACFAQHHWALPPNSKWDITDFGLGNFEYYGLVLINLATEPEYCEKLMWARRGHATPCHAQAKKKEDIICRAGKLTIDLWPTEPAGGVQLSPTLTVPINDEPTIITTGLPLALAAGSRVTLIPGGWHEFYPTSDACIIGEVSTANDDLHDNIFLSPDVGRFPGIEEDEPAAVRLLSE